MTKKTWKMKKKGKHKKKKTTKKEKEEGKSIETTAVMSYLHDIQAVYGRHNLTSAYSLSHAASRQNRLSLRLSASALGTDVSLVLALLVGKLRQDPF